MIPVRLPFTLRPWQQLAGAVLVSGVAALLLVRGVYLPLWGSLWQTRADAYDLQVKLADAETLLPKVEQARERLERTRRIVHDLQHQVGGGSSLARMLDELSACATRAGVEMSVSQESAAPMPFAIALSLQQVPVTLRLSGRYHQIGQFFTQLSQAPFLAQVRSFSLSRTDPESPELSAEAALELMLTQESPDHAF